MEHLSHLLQSKPVPAFGTVDSESHVCSDKRQAKQHKLEEEPSPTSALLLRPLAASGTSTVVVAKVLWLATGLATGAVEVLGLDLDDVVIVRKLACLA